MIQNCLYWRDRASVLLRCLDEEQVTIIIEEMHSGVCGGHYIAKKTAHKILRSRYWWPSLFYDTHRMVKRCDAC